MGIIMERGKKVRESASETPIFTGKLVYDGTVLKCKNRDTGNRRELQSETQRIQQKCLSIFFSNTTLIATICGIIMQASLKIQILNCESHDPQTVGSGKLKIDHQIIKNLQRNLYFSKNISSCVFFFACRFMTVSFNIYLIILKNIKHNATVQIKHIVYCQHFKPYHPSVRNFKFCQKI